MLLWCCSLLCRISNKTLSFIVENNFRQSVTKLFRLMTFLCDSLFLCPGQTTKKTKTSVEGSSLAEALFKYVM